MRFLTIAIILARRFRQAQTGSVAIEFGFVITIFMVMIFTMLEILLVTLSANVLENAVNEMSRVGMTGYYKGGDRSAYLKQLVQERTAPLLDPEQIQIEMKSYGDFIDVGQPEPFNDKNGNSMYDEGEDFTDVNYNGQWDADIGVDSPGEAGEVVLYTLSYDWDMIMPFASQVFGEDGVVPLSSSVLVKNEPYGSE